MYVCRKHLKIAFRVLKSKSRDKMSLKGLMKQRKHCIFDEGKNLLKLRFWDLKPNSEKSL